MRKMLSSPNVRSVSTAKIEIRSDSHAESIDYLHDGSFDSHLLAHFTDFFSKRRDAHSVG